MEPLVHDIPPALVRHFAAEARALDASELNDYTEALDVVGLSDQRSIDEHA
jgi:hypothetical protein